MENKNSHRGSFFSCVQNEKKPMFFLTPELVIQHISQAAYMLFDGYCTLAYCPVLTVFDGFLSDTLLSQFLRGITSIEKGFSWSGVFSLSARNKKKLYVHMAVFPYFEEKAVSGYIVFFENITESYVSRERMLLTNLLKASTLKDNDTGFHNERLNFYSKELAKILFIHNLYQEIDAEFVENIGFFAAMHDIGKIGTPDDILQKKGALTENEWKIMREHTINGAYLLAFYPNPLPKAIALSHHERWDGSGYPYNLFDEMIPLAARIVAVADVYDALRMERPYKRSFSHREASEYLIANSGSHFDPQLIYFYKKIHYRFADIWNELTDGRYDADLAR